MTSKSMSTKSTALTVEQALAAVLDGVVAVDESERVDLMSAAGRVLAAPLAATLTQPPFTASAMDGYAVRAADVASLPATLRVIGEAAAGHAFPSGIAAGEAVRIFTGAPLPAGADAIVIQENTRRDGTQVTVTKGPIDPDYVRPRGGDFLQGQTLLPSGRRLSARDVTIAAAMGHAHLLVRRRPTVAILATGDELVLPGETPRADQIVCSNPFGVAALAASAGAAPTFLGIAADTRESLTSHIARAAKADILVTLGGASVGDHDLVGPVLRERGLSLAFWKIAMRPGKPLMFGTLGGQRVLGLPGNPVSSLITARLFLVPLINALLGQPPAISVMQRARSAVALGSNGPRAHYMRATSHIAPDGELEVRPVRSQDSSLLSPLVAADCLIVRPIGAGPVAAGQSVSILPLDL
jgi:molybdopterin molybdotransferase